MRTTLPPLSVRSGEVGTSLIVIAVTGMLPNQKGTFHAPTADLDNPYDTRAVLVARDTETPGQWTTYHGVSMTADDRTWTDTVAMARYIQNTVL